MKRFLPLALFLFVYSLVGAQNTVEVFIWEDLNGNGIQDLGETGIDTATPELWEDTNGSGAIDVGDTQIGVLTHTGIPVLGTYSIPALDGSYAVLFCVPPPGVLNYFPTDFDNDGNNTQATDGDRDSDAMTVAGVPPGACASAHATSYIFALSGAIVFRNVDAGYFFPVTVEGEIWHDIDADGMEEGEGGFPENAMICLVDCNTGAAALAADGTVLACIDRNGIWGWPDQVWPGEYEVIITLPSIPQQSYLSDEDYSGGNTQATDVDDDSDFFNDGSGLLSSHCFTLNSGETESDVDAGLFYPVTIGDFVWHDANADGIQNTGAGGFPNETGNGLVGIDISILDDMGNPVFDVNGNLVGLETTDAVGAYDFVDLIPGQYSLTFNIISPWQGSPMLDPDPLFNSNDSDADPNTGITPLFTVISGQDINQVDFGLWRTVSVGGVISVFDDACVFISNPAGVQLEIWEDVNNDDVPDNNLGVTVSSDGTGAYCFTDLVPGNYQVAILETNFGIGGTLLGTVPGYNICGSGVEIDPDNDIAGDDNTSTSGTTADVFSLAITLWCGEEPGTDGVENKTLDFSMVQSCDNVVIPPASICDSLSLLPYSDLFPICNLNTLENYCAVMHPWPSSNSNSQLCPGGGIFNNTSWFSFIAGGTNVQMQFVPDNCVPRGQNQVGIQAGIYTDCSLTTSVFCQHNCSTAPINISATLIPGEEYFVFFDGCAGSVCEVEVNIVSGGGDFELPNDITIESSLPANNDTIDICPGKTIDFSLIGIDLDDLDYHWTISGNNPPAFIDLTNQNQNSVTFPDEGNWDICFVYAENKCDFTNNTQQCLTVNSEYVPDELFMDYYLCRENFVPADSGPQDEDPNLDGDIGWHGPPFTGPSDPFPIVNTATNADGCSYEQIITVFEYPSPEVGIVDTAYCTGSNFVTGGGLVIFDIGPPPGLTFNDWLPDAGLNGCDSMTNYTVVEIVNSYEIEKLLCSNGCLNIRPLELFPGRSSLYDNVTVTWIDGTGTVLATGPYPLEVMVCQSTTVYLTVTVEHKGVSCEFDGGSLDVDIDALIPPALQADPYMREICEGEDLQTYSIIDPSDPDISFVWDITSPGELLPPSGELTANVDWHGASGVQTISVYAVNSCGTGPPTNLVVTITSAPTAEVTASDLTCITDNAIIEYTGSNINIDGYTWDFGGGTAVGSDGGPYDVTWGSAGLYYVSLMVEENGCMSEMVLDSVEVADVLPPPVINCGNITTDMVEFTWTDVQGATGYSVDVVSGQSGTLTGTTYSVTGLGVNTIVEIIVTAEGPAPCGNSLESVPVQCQTQDCTPPVVSVSVPNAMVDTTCLDASAASFIFNVDVNPVEPGTGTFSGPSVDTSTGEFDPNSADIGQNIINYAYVTDDGCSANANVVVWVFQPPTADFDEQDNLTQVCVGQEVTFDWNGAGNPDEYIWDAEGQLLQSFPSQMLSWPTAGDYVVSLVTAENGCESSEPFTYSIEVLAPLSIPEIICTESTTTSVTFEWTSVTNSQDYTVEISIDGGTPTVSTETGTTIDVTGLTEGQNVTITVTANPTAGYPCPETIDNDMCTASSCVQGLTFNYNVADGQEYCIDAALSTIDFDVSVTGGTGLMVADAWSASGGTMDNNGVWDPSGLTQGIYTITYDYNEGQCPYQSTTTVELITLPVADFLVDNLMICVDNTVNIVYTGDLSTGYQFAWTFDNATVLSGSGAGPYEVQWDGPGIYNIEVIVDNNGCESTPVSRMVTVEDVIAPVVFVGCQTDLDQVTFEWAASSCATEYLISYSINGGATQNTTSTATTFNVPGLSENDVVDITVDINSSGTCLCLGTVAMDQCIAQSCPPIQVDPSSPVTEFCNNDAPSPFIVDPRISGGSGGGVGMWIGSSAIDPFTGEFDPVMTVVGANTFTYEYSESGCDYESLPFTITVYDFPVPDAIVTNSGCFTSPDGTIDLSATGGDGVYIYMLNGSIANPPSTVPPGNYSVEVEDGNGCMSSIDVVVLSPNVETVDLSGQLLLETGTQQTINMSTTVDGADIESIVWTQNGNVVCDDLSCGTYDYTAQEGSSTFEVTITYNNGCMITDNIMIVGQTTEITSIYVPSVFSPNNDDVNPLLIIGTSDDIVAISYFRVFDRWGNRMFSVDEFIPGDPGAAWDGKFQGRDVVPGVYVFILEYVTDDGEKHLLNGDVTVIR